MREYNVKIQEEVVVGIAYKVIEYLEQFPGDYVECTVTKVILDEESPFSDKSIIDIAKRLLFPLLFNGEEVDLLGFIGRMFEKRKELITRVIKEVTELIGGYVDEIRGYMDSSMSDPDMFSDLISNIAKIVSTLWDNLR